MKPVLYEKKTYTVQEIMKILGIGKKSAYQLVQENRFKSFRIGSSIRISKESFDKWLNEKI
ncbi:helix-turn-helix domain-containing protein [Faecalicoccus pleomorphus]|uniref:helix-turn-helix domain-containing protein n=1 Tax=Faecalicoccus pleomorphus TaxID=1323 RepID=UPI001898B9F6|nr:helix-turn-helix domain-containing protein [Faecalicoccus pleomorphus]MDB7985044.1 helix-turn-helix domain-containing protein [Faecalicoccus pleomorphus]